MLTSGIITSKPPVGRSDGGGFVPGLPGTVLLGGGVLKFPPAEDSDAPVLALTGGGFEFVGTVAGVDEVSIPGKPSSASDASLSRNDS